VIKALDICCKQETWAENKVNESRCCGMAGDLSSVTSSAEEIPERADSTEDLLGRPAIIPFGSEEAKRNNDGKSGMST